MQVNLTSADKQSETLSTRGRPGYFPNAIATFNHPGVVVNNDTLGGQGIADHVHGNISQSVRNRNSRIIEVQVGGAEKTEAPRPVVSGWRKI